MAEPKRALGTGAQGDIDNPESRDRPKPKGKAKSETKSEDKA